MTSASELFHNRRSRPGRSDPDFGSDPSLNRFFSHHQHGHDSHRRHRHRHRHNHGHHHYHRHDSDGCDPLRRAPNLRQFCHRVAFSERSPIRNNEGSSQYLSRSSATDLETHGNTSRGSLTGNERLPGTVLLARARLLERLRGVSLSGNRRSNRASVNYQRESTLDNEMGLNSTDWVSFFPDLTFQPEGPQLYQERNKKPQGLTQEALNRLDRWVFSSTKVNNETRDCSICLENFTEGDTLVRLPCSHRFHSPCLDPWVRTRGECPYCRRVIPVLGNEP